MNENGTAMNPTSPTHPWLTPELQALKPEFDKPSAPYSTYRIGGGMEVAWFPTSKEEAIQLLIHLAPLIKAGETTLNILGWGSNTLIATAGIHGNTLITRKMANIQQIGEGRFIIEAGVHLAKVANTCLEHSVANGEFLIGIPGTMGGATLMNAGAMGQETAAIVERAYIYDIVTEHASWVDAKTLGYTYRHSHIETPQHIVLATECTFPQGDKAATKARMDENMKFRKTHHPIEPNGGSVFRNPEGFAPVGKMMDELGAKGQWRVGGAMVSPLHGNFIINTGDATSHDVLALMLRMKHAVADAYGATIFPENKFIGHATAEEAQLYHALREGDPHHAC
jgi:UDP-N-acetylmuramate dehydrogenase